MSSEHGYSISELMGFIDKSDICSEKEKIQLKLSMFEKFTSWSEENYCEYEKLLNELKVLKRKRANNTSEIGKALEKLVTFIFEKSYFYKVYPNKRTGTNEIDQFIVLSNKGKQAIHEFNFSLQLLCINDGYFLSECKNYKETVSSTWVGKFYTLLKVSGDCQLGIIFSCEGLTGSENSWYDAHGLTKIIYRMSDEDRRVFILDFNMNDFELLLNKKNTIFSIINHKKESLVSCVNSIKLNDDECEGKEEIEKIFEEIKTLE